MSVCSRKPGNKIFAAVPIQVAQIRNLLYNVVECINIARISEVGAADCAGDPWNSGGRDWVICSLYADLFSWHAIFYVI